MPLNQDKTSSGKKVDNIYAHNKLCSTRARELRIDLAHDATVGERSRNSKFSYAHQDPSMEYTSNKGKGVHLHTLVDRERKRSNERG